MKSPYVLLTTVAIGFMAAPAFAQDAAAPIRRSSPSPAAQAPALRPEETPAPREEPKPVQTPKPVETPRPIETPKPTPTATPTATPETTATPAPTTPAPTPAISEPNTASSPAAAERPSVSPTEAKPASKRPSARGRRVLNEKPVRAVEPRPRRPWDDSFSGPGLTRPTFDLSRRAGGSVTSTLRALENRWQMAIMSNDVATISKLVADDFVGTSSTGKVGSKSALLAAVRRDKNVYKSATARGMSVRSLGPDVAVVTGTSTEVGTTPDGKRFKVSRRFTDTWRERNGKWQCVASQATAIAKD